jgi:hypothetical protein
MCTVARATSLQVHHELQQLGALHSVTVVWYAVMTYVRYSQ